MTMYFTITIGGKKIPGRHQEPNIEGFILKHVCLQVSILIILRVGI